MLFISNQHVMQPAAINLTGLATMQAVWSRALGLPIERPKSVTMDVIEKKFAGT